MLCAIAVFKNFSCFMSGKDLEKLEAAKKRDFLEIAN